MAGYYIVLSLHILGACVWAGGHLVLAASVLPRALRQRSAAVVLDYERSYERIGLPALGIQLITGLWLAHRLLGSPSAWLSGTSLAHAVQLKLALLAGTVALAVHAKLSVLPRLRDDNLPVLASHIVLVTILAVLLVLSGAGIRLGGYPFFQS